MSRTNSERKTDVKRVILGDIEQCKWSKTENVYKREGKRNRQDRSQDSGGGSGTRGEKGEVPDQDLNTKQWI